jgi:signal transduction histidine kinase
VAALAIPTLAEWCVVYLVEEQGERRTIRRAASAHQDAARAALLDRLDRAFPLDLDQPSGALLRVVTDLEAGRPVLFSNFDEATMAALARRGQHRAVLRRLGMASVMIVPLVARGQTMGALIFSSAATCRYDDDDLALGMELGRRAALAIDNARLYRQAQDAIRIRDSLISAVSHDLRNPLGIVKGYAQMLRQIVVSTQPASADRLISGLAKIDQMVGKMNGQINQLLDLTRLQLGRPIPLETRPTDLVALARQVSAEYQEMSSRHVLQVQTALPALIAQIDAGRLERVFGNLLSNAIKFSPGGGEVGVSVGVEADADGTWAVVSVRDQGIGIPAADLPRLFDLFYRASNSAGQIGGTGIGLASARFIVEHHGGTLTVESQEGVGSTFNVRLPLGGRG